MATQGSRNNKVDVHMQAHGGCGHMTIAHSSSAPNFACSGTERGAWDSTADCRPLIMPDPMPLLSGDRLEEVFSHFCSALPQLSQPQDAAAGEHLQWSLFEHPQ